MPAKILVVDDEQDILRLVEIKVKKAGFEVITARDGEEAVKKAKESKPDLVLMDVMMPKKDGFTAAQEIKAQVKPVPIIIMLTAQGQETDIQEGLEHADDYIIKPFSPRELIARINVALIKAGKEARVEAG